MGFMIFLLITFKYNPMIYGISNGRLRPNPDIEKIDIANLEGLERFFLK